MKERTLGISNLLISAVIILSYFFFRNYFFKVLATGEFLILLLCIPAFIHYTWAFPLMFYYLLNLLDQIVDNSVDRLGNYLSGWEYRRRQLEKEGAN